MKQKTLLLRILFGLGILTAGYYALRYVDNRYPPTERHQSGGDFPIKISSVDGFDRVALPNARLWVCLRLTATSTCRYKTIIATDSTGHAILYVRRTDAQTSTSVLDIIAQHGNGQYEGTPSSGKAVVEIVPWIGK